VAAAIWPDVALAEDFDVSTTADGDDSECVLDCTLREAVSLARSGDQVNLRGGNYVLTQGELVLNNDTIVGENARTTFIDGGDKSRVLTVIEVTSRVSAVTIRNGNGLGFKPDGLGGGIFIHSGTLLLQNSTVSGNTGTHGGGIAANGIAQLIGVTVSGNTGSTGRLTRGGGIATSATGGLLLGNSTVSGNTAVDQVGTASQGGGIHSAGALSIIASTIAGNSAAEGGGLYMVPPPTQAATSLQNSLLSHGTGGACGGPGLGNLTATANVISDESCQLKDSSNLQGVNPRIGALADSGGPTNTHALLPDSPAIGRAGSCAMFDQRGFNRVAPCDSGAYEYRAPTLRVVMQVINDSGGTRTPAQFDLHVRTGGTDVKGSPQDGSANGTTYTLEPGAYSVAADAAAGYTLSVSGDCAANGSITLQEGQNRTCTITASDIAPTLRVVTNVVNDQGGTLTAASFTAHVRNGAFDVANSPQPGSGAGTVYTLSAGPTYTVAADAVAGYSLAVTGACASNGNVTLQVGQDATCTITATDDPPTLQVVATVINDHGGTLAPANLSAHVRAGGTDVNGSPQPGTTTGTLYTLSAGVTYTVAADAVSGYALTVSGDCAANGTITMQLDQDRTCTITANDVAPTLRVITTVTNDNGGTRTPAGFDVHVRSGPSDVAGSPQPGSDGGTAYTLAAGTYSVAADGVSGYTFTFSGDCATSGTITLAVGQSRTCTITANDVAPTLRVITNVTNDNGGTRAPAGFNVHVRAGGTDVANSPRAGDSVGSVYTLPAGTYSVAADDVTGYTFAVSGACATNGSVTLQVGQNLTCTITANDVAPTLRVISAVSNDAGGTLAVSGVTANVRQGANDVPGSPQPGSGTGTDYTLSGGTTYRVGADEVGGYTFAVAGDCALDGTITLQVGQNATCTITASDVAPTLTVITEVVTDDGGTLTAGDVSARVRQGANDVPGSPQPGSATGTEYALRAGPTYTVSADAVAGYTRAISGACAADGNVTLPLGQNRTCTITLDDDEPRLHVITNVVNDDGGDLDREDVDVHVRRGGADVPDSPQAGMASPGAEYDVIAGAHVVAADPVDGYSVAYGPACGPTGAITLALGQDATCTVTLDDGAATLTVATEVVNDDGGSATPGDFDVSVRQNGVEIAGEAGDAAGTPYSLAGQTAYTVAGGGVPGYTVAVAGDCGADGSITLPLSQARACTITADDVAPRLTVVTQVVNDHGGTAAPGGFTVHVRRGGADVSGSPQPGSGSGTTYTVSAGAHTVAADAVSGYAASISGDCAGDGSITLGVGDSRTCTVTANDDPPPPTARPSANVQQLPPPEPGKSVNALPKSGKVKVKLPGSAAYVDLDEGQQLPVGTLVDARKGHVTLVAAANDSGGTATAEFWAGIFRLGQTKGRAPTTVLTLVEKLSCPKAGRAIAAAKKRKRRLWGDGSGKFQTRGKHSAATVVGTGWLVEDRCSATLTRVVRGRVSVRDFVKKKTVIVRAGKKYVARAKKQ
jgi:hypothetical protein